MHAKSLLMPQHHCGVCCTQRAPGGAGLVCPEGFDPASLPLKSLSHSPIGLYLSRDTAFRQLQGPADFNLLGRKILSSVQESTTAPHQRNVNRE